MHLQFPSFVVSLVKLLIGLLVFALSTGCDLDDTPEEIDCPAAEQTITLTEGWRFALDPDNIGSQSGWHTSTFDDSAWQELAPGRPWEAHGTDDSGFEYDGIDYDGVAWYRIQFAPPDWETLYLVVSGIDDVATLWINGEETPLRTFGAGVETASLNGHGAPITLAFRVEDHGGYGGIVDPVRLAMHPEDALFPRQAVLRMAEANPNWPMPGWTRGSPLAWTLTGGVNHDDETLVSIDGAIAPWPAAPTVEAWLYDPASGELLHGGGITEFSLVNGNLPIPQWIWEKGGAVVQNTLFFDESDFSVRWMLTLNTETALRLLVVTRPFAVSQTTAPIHAASLKDPTRLWVNNQPFMIAAQKPNQSGVGALEDVMVTALHGTAPQLNTLACMAAGEGAVILVYEIKSGETANLNFAFPVHPGEAFPATDGNMAERLEASATFWQAQTGRVRFDIPDSRINASVPTSIGYLLLANDSDGPHPGSLAHDAIWVRDAAYTGLALLQVGHADTVRNYISILYARQEADGRVPPIQGEAAPWNDDEWDSQGQAIFLLTSYFRYTGDLDTLREYYPQARLAAEFLVSLRETPQSILPPSLSAEDLGPPDQHYYWDNFWAVTGLEESAFAAQTLGYPEDAAWMQAEADSLREAILQSITAVMGDPPAYIPAAVEDTESSAMARGSVPVLWPYRVFPVEMPLLARAFDYYHQHWIAPYNGAYLHRQAQFWPYGGIELAHVYLRLGRGDVLHQILGWTLTNQTLPGTFAWAEQIDPTNGGFSGGDMPHAWAAGSYVTLIREMLFSETGDTLHLFNSVPEWWFEDGRSVTVEDAPTHFGALTLRAAGTLQNVDGAWQGTLTLSLSGAQPPGGFHWQMPFAPAQITGIPDAQFNNETNTLIIPSSGGELDLVFTPR